MKPSTPKTELPPSTQLRKLLFGGSFLSGQFNVIARRPLHCAAALAVCAWLAGVGPAAARGRSQITIQNNHTTNVNDLHIVFSTSKATNVTFNGKAGVFNATARPPRWDFEGFDLAKGGKGKLAYEPSSSVILVKDGSSQWTVDNVPVTSTVKIPPGQTPQEVTYVPETGETLATFLNLDPFPIVYVNIALYADNNPPDSNPDSVFIPTGTRVPGVPTSVTLQPGERRVFSFGVTDPARYDLVIAYAAALDSPNDLFRVATAGGHSGLSFLNQPQSQAVAAGSDVTFSAQTTGTPPFYWQWFFNGLPMDGAVDSALSLTNVQSPQAGVYSVAVSNVSGSASSAPAQLLVNNPPLLAPVAPILVHQGEQVERMLAASDLDANQSLTFSVNVGGLQGVRLDPATGVLTFDSSAVPAPGTNLLTVDVMDDGLPALHAQQTVLVVIARPVEFQAITQADGGVTLTWNSIPGRKYLVRSAHEVANPAWDYHATVVADSELTAWNGFLNTETPGTFFMINTVCDTCPCDTLTNGYVHPNFDRKNKYDRGVSFEFGSTNPPTPTSVTIDVPFWLFVKIHCATSTGACTGDLTISGDATWQIVNESGATNTSSAKASSVYAETMVTGTCGSTNAETRSPEMNLKATIDLGGVEKDTRKRLIATTDRLYLRVQFRLRITARCNGRSQVANVIVAVDSRSDPNDGTRQGHFDRGNSDLDGDTKLGKDEPGNSNAEKYKNDMDPDTK